MVQDTLIKVFDFENNATSILRLQGVTAHKKVVVPCYSTLTKKWTRDHVSEVKSLGGNVVYVVCLYNGNLITLDGNTQLLQYNAGWIPVKDLKPNMRLQFHSDIHENTFIQVSYVKELGNMQETFSVVIDVVGSLVHLQGIVIKTLTKQKA